MSTLAGNVNVIEQNELKINLLGKTVIVNEQPVSLTRREFDLLLYFVSNKNKVVSKGALAEHLSGEVADMFDDDKIQARYENGLLSGKLHYP